MEERDDLQAESAVDRMTKLDDDAIMHVFTYLSKPSDVANAAAVSRSWHRIVIESRLWRTLCIRQFSEIDMFEPSMVGSIMQQAPSNAVCQSLPLQQLSMEHQAYMRLHTLLLKEPQKGTCILKAISASSTDHLPDESIVETLHPSPMLFEEFPSYPSYWSSKGQECTEAPEFLTYQLLTTLCVVHEVRIRPFKAYFQLGNPIYSAKYVRFRMGYPSSSSTSTASTDLDACNDYVWTYVSPEFPMEKADTLQHFKFNPPVLCVGGVLQIELLGRVQTQRMDQLYYFCICHVYVLGTPIHGFDFDVIKHKLLLKYDPGKLTTEAADASSNDQPQNEPIFALGAVQLDGPEFALQDQSFLHNILGNIAVQNLLAVDGHSDGEDEDENEASSEDEDENMVYF